MTRVTDLGSAPVPPLGPDDHVRGPEQAPLLIAYADFECPYCAREAQKAQGTQEVRWVFRHFPVKSKHPRAWAAAAAAEAAHLQSAFWEFHDGLFQDQGRLEDPHLWTRAQQLGLDLQQFDHDRRSAAVAERIRRDFRSGIRAGVVATPTLFRDGRVATMDTFRVEETEETEGRQPGGQEGKQTYE
jgi:protein-disulfide isomerase